MSLQANISGDYVDLPPHEGTLLIFCGAVLTLLSKGKIISPTHRVLAPPLAQRVASARTSSVFFLRPHPSFVFSRVEAQSYGFDITTTNDNSNNALSFKEWIEGNYNGLKTNFDSTSR